MTVKPLPAPGLEPRRVQGFLHPWGKLNAVFFLYLSFLSTFTSPLHAQPGWGPDVRLVFWPGGSHSPKIVGSDSMVHVVWWGAFSDSTGGYDEVFYKRSTDEGATWGPEVMLSTKDNKTSNAQAITVCGSDVHVVWHDYGIGTMYRRSTDYGVSWGSIDTLLGNDLTGFASIAAAGESVYVVANAPSQHWNVYTWSTDRGVTWSFYRIISYREAQRIPLQVHPPFLHIAKDPLDSTAGTLKTYYLRSTDGGRSWGRDTLISDTDSSGSQAPALDVDYRGNPHVTWYDYRYSPYPWTGDIFYTSSRDSGTAWVPPDSLTVVHRAVGSSILAQGDTLHLVWADDRNGFDTNFEMYYRMSTDLGVSWNPEVRLMNALGNSYGPSLGLTQNFLHLVWEDEREDPSRHMFVVYYKRKAKASGVTFQEFLSGGSGRGNTIRVFPNPMKGFCEVQAYGKEAPNVSIYDVLGRAVRVLPPLASSLTPYTFIWDGRDDQRKEVRSGVYFIQIETVKGRETHKLILMR